MSVILRKARQTDGPQVFELIWSARADIPLKDSFYSDDCKAFIGGECQRGKVWIAEREGVIVGTLYIQGNELFYLVVAKDMRQKGVARLLLSKGKKTVLSGVTFQPFRYQSSRKRRLCP
jgi:N-acetylglutamate synthase-like GNAT family acetyltransferase